MRKISVGTMGIACGAVLLLGWRHGTSHCEGQ